MRRIKYLLLMAVCMVFMLSPMNTQAAGDVQINATNFPDANFRTYLLKQDYGSDGVISASEIEQITSISVFNRRIKTLQGLENFGKLKRLDCFDNQISELPELPSTLELLVCDWNQLSELPELPASLSYLYCYNNNLSKLPELPVNLKQIDASYNYLQVMPELPAGKEWDSDDYIFSPQKSSDEKYSYDSEKKCLTISGKGAIEDYKSHKDTPWCSYRDEIETIIIEDGITKIGKNAFYGCKNLKKVTIGDSVECIGENAFWNCSKLDDVVIPASVKNIEQYAFAYCWNLDNIYFEGSAPNFGNYVFKDIVVNAYYQKLDPSWNAKKQGYGGSVTWIPWYGMREEGYLYVERMDLGDIVINGSGYGYAYFNLTDAKGKPIKNQNISYTFSGTDYSNSTSTDAQGVFGIRTMHLTKTTNLEAVFSVNVSLPVKNTTQTITATVTPPSFKQAFSQESFISGGGDVKIADGAVGVGSGAETEYSVSDEGKKLTISESVNSEWSLGTLNLKHQVKKALGNGCFPVLKAKTSAKWTDNITIGLEINDYNEKDPVQAARITSLLLAKHTGSLVIAQIAESLAVRTGAEDAYDFYINQIGLESSVSLGETGSVTLKNGDIKLASAGVNTEYSAAMSTNETEGTLAKSMGVKTTGNMNLLNFDTVKTSLFSAKKSNIANVEVETDTKGKSTISSTMTNGLEGNVTVLQTAKSTTRTMTLDDESATKLQDVQKLVTGELAFVGTTAFGNILDKMWSKSVDGIISDSQKTKTGINVEVEKGYPKNDPVLTIGIGTGLAQETSYNYGTSAWLNGKEHKLSESTVKMEDFAGEMITIQDVYKNALEGCYDLFVQVLNSKKGRVSESGVRHGSVIIGGQGRNFDAGISTVNDANAVQAAFYTIGEEDVMLMTAGEEVTATPVFTLGNPYYVEISKEDGSVVSNEELKSEDIYITMEYDEAMLVEAGITDENAIGLYWYDPENYVHIYQKDAVIDTEANTVTAVLKANGEYVLGVDRTAPVISDMSVSNHTSESEFKAIITDDSGIGSVEMVLDGKVVVNEDNFNEYYDHETREFIYPMKDLKAGERKILLNACDMLGNMAEEASVYTFTVDNEKPLIGEVLLPETKCEAGKPLMIQVSAADDQLIGNVYCKLTNANGFVKYIELAEDETERWSGDISADLGSGEYSVEVTASDEAGNQAVYILENNVLIWSKDDYVISKVESTESDNDEIVIIKNATSTDSTALLVCLSYDENGELVSKDTANAELLNYISTDVVISKTSDERIAWKKYFLVKDNQVLSNVYIDEITALPRLELPLEEQVIEKTEDNKYLINLINNENISLKEGRQYVLLSVSNQYEGDIDAETLLKNDLCTYADCLEPVMINESLKVYFGEVSVNDADLYLVGDGKVQEILELSEPEIPDGIEISEENFPDEYFRTYLLAQDYGSDGVISASEIEQITEIIVHSRGIKTLKGLEYFSKLEYLFCDYNDLNELPKLPVTLKYLSCDDNHLSELPELPSSLERLECGDNELSELPELPSSLVRLSCGYNELSKLPELPSSLEWLFCYDNELSELPELSLSLKTLYCGKNKLSELPGLPSSLENLECGYNELSKLPELSSSLECLYCYGNKLSELPKLPSSLEWLECYDNELSKLPELPSNLNGIDVRNNYFQAMPELPEGKEWDSECYIFSPQKDSGTTPEIEKLVVRVSGATRYETGYKVADELKAVLGVEKFEAVVVATGKNFADALAGSYLAVEKNAPILLTNGKDANIAELHTYIKANVTAGGKVYILGGEGAVPKTVDAIEGYDVVRLYGDSRYDTNLAILKEAGISGDSVIVATGKTFADSLSASAAKLPILLVKPNAALNDAQKEVLAGMKNIYIVGGEGAVSAAYEAELKEFGTVTRVFGDSRYDTSVEVAKTFCKDVDMAVVASGKNFPDGLCGGPLAAALNAPLVLTKDGGTDAAAGYVEENGIASGYVLGGTGALADATVVEVFNLESADEIIY